MSDAAGKKPYRKPTLRTIELETKEVMGIGCKTDEGGPQPLQPAACGLAMSCKTAGS